MEFGKEKIWVGIGCGGQGTCADEKKTLEKLFGGEPEYRITEGLQGPDNVFQLLLDHSGWLILGWLANRIEEDLFDTGFMALVSQFWTKVPEPDPEAEAIAAHLFELMSKRSGEVSMSIPLPGQSAYRWAFALPVRTPAEMANASRALALMAPEVEKFVLENEGEGVTFHRESLEMDRAVISVFRTSPPSTDKLTVTLRKEGKVSVKIT